MIETQIRELTLPKCRYVVEGNPPQLLYRCTVVELHPSNEQIGSYFRRPTLTDVSQKSACRKFHQQYWETRQQ